MQFEHLLSSILSCGAVCFVMKCGSNILICGSNHAVCPFFAGKATEQYFHVLLFVL